MFVEQYKVTTPLYTDKRSESNIHWRPNKFHLILLKKRNDRYKPMTGSNIAVKTKT